VPVKVFATVPVVKFAVSAAVLLFLSVAVPVQ